MAEMAAQSTLLQKAEAQRRALGGGAVSLPRALGRSLSIAGDTLWRLGLSVAFDGDTVCTAERAIKAVPDGSLLIVLDGPSGQNGLAALDRSLVTGLVEVQTLGKVTTFPLDTRAFTATDAAMVMPLLDAALPRFSTLLTGQPEHAHLQGFMFGARADDPQSAALALEAVSYRALTGTMTLAHGVRTGRIAILFPEKPSEPSAGEGWSAGRHEALFKSLPTPLNAVLTRIHLPLARAQALKPGDVLDISAAAIGAATLVGHGGHVVARGKLGQLDGFRALRVGTDAPPRPPALAPAAMAAPQTLPVPAPVAPPMPPAPPDLDPALPDDLSDLIDPPPE